MRMLWYVVSDEGHLRRVKWVLLGELEVEQELLTTVDASLVGNQPHFPLVELVSDIVKLEIEIRAVLQFLDLVV